MDKHVVVRKSVHAALLKQPIEQKRYYLQFQKKDEQLSHNDSLCLKRIGNERPVLQSRTQGASHGAQWMTDWA